MPIEEFKDLFITEINIFAGHVHRVFNQYAAQKELKKNCLAAILSYIWTSQKIMLVDCRMKFRLLTLI